MSDCTHFEVTRDPAVDEKDDDDDNNNSDRSSDYDIELSDVDEEAEVHHPVSDTPPKPEYVPHKKQGWKEMIVFSLSTWIQQLPKATTLPRRCPRRSSAQPRSGTASSSPHTYLPTKLQIKHKFEFC